MSKRTIYSRFQEMVNKYPENPAIVEDNRTLRARLINWGAPGVAGLERFSAYERLSIAGYVIEPKAEKRPSQRRHLVISSRASQLDMS